MDMEHPIMFQNAVMNLQSGHLMPWDYQILAAMPLSSTLIEPYTSKEVPDVQMSMKITCEAMNVWIEESKKTSYFSKHFVKLSRMIMNGVTSMARGLITLHSRGEDLSSAPMSIQDLIGTASYQFRKSHLGVLQTVKSHPEISTRLLLNQIGWNNILMRLFKTKEKLAQPVVHAEAPVPGEQSLPAGEQDTGAKAMTGAKERGLSMPSALAEPGAFCAPRAFSSLDHGKNTASRKGSSTAKSLKSGTSEENPVSGIQTKAQTNENQTTDQKNSSAELTGNIEKTEEQNQTPAPGKTETNNDAEISGAAEQTQKSESTAPTETRDRVPNTGTAAADTSPDENTRLLYDPFDLAGGSAFRDLEDFFFRTPFGQRSGLSP